jgi:hypothetical protein
MVLDTVPNNLVPIITAHASLAYYLSNNKFKPFDKDRVTYTLHNWINTPFRKVVCKVNQKEFGNLKELSNINITTASELYDTEVAITLLSSFYSEIPNVVKFAKLWKF